MDLNCKISRGTVKLNVAVFVLSALPSLTGETLISLMASAVAMVDIDMLAANKVAKGAQHFTVDR